MNSKSQINLKLAVLCVCPGFLSLIAATKTLQEKDESEDLRSLWPNVPLLPIVYPTSPSLPDGPCKRQAQCYLRDLKNETLWATQMFDASTKYPEGIISGHTRHLGNFDLCYDLKVTLRPDDNDESSVAEEEITGRYCLIDIEYHKKGLPPVDPLERHDFKFNPQGSVWEAIREKGDFRRKKRYLLQMALCVPEVCSAEDIEAALQEPFARVGVSTNVQFNVSVKRHFCQALKDAPKPSQGTKIYCLVLVLLLSLFVLCTWYDYSLNDYEVNSGTMMNDMVLCFSVRRNLKTIMKISRGHPGLDTIHLMRILYVAITIFGHRALVYTATPVVNISYSEWLYTYNKASTVMLAAPQVIEGFFAIGGMLTSYNILSKLDENKKMNFFETIITRFVRLTPSYALVVFFNIVVLPHIGNGPNWEWKIGLERDSCASNWWANLLYINNYVNPEKICLFQTWYLSVDFQLYILAMFVTYAFWQMPRKYGFTFLCLVILSGCVVPFINTYFYNVQPIFMGLLHMHEIREVTYFTNHYVKTHERITSYFIGVLAGAVLNDHKRNPWRLSKVATHILFVVLFMGFGVGSMLTAGKYYDPNQNPGRLETALHACLHRGAFALASSSVIVLITVGQGLTICHNLLTPRWVQPLAKITYGAYLVHSMIQLYDVGVTRIGRQFSFYNWFWNFVPDFVFSFSLALFLALTVEEPFKNLFKRLIRKSGTSETSNKKPPKTKKGN